MQKIRKEIDRKNHKFLITAFLLVGFIIGAVLLITASGQFTNSLEDMGGEIPQKIKSTQETYLRKNEALLKTVAVKIQELKEENSMFLEKLKEAYRQNFSYLRAHPVLEEFYSTSEEKILEEAMRNIRIELSKINKAEMALKDSYTKETICKVMIEKQRQSKSRGKGFGVWHD